MIENALGEVDGVASEYQYLEEIFGQHDVGLFQENQDFRAGDEGFYDKMDIERADKTRITKYFDINRILWHILNNREKPDANLFRQRHPSNLS